MTLYDIACIGLHEKQTEVETIRVSDELHNPPFVIHRGQVPG